MTLRNPFDQNHSINGCSCGQHKSHQEHAAAEKANGTFGFEEANPEEMRRQALESAAMRAIFPHDETRRAFLKVVGAGTAYSVIASLFPFSALETMAAETGKVEKPDLKIGFIPITCATPIIMAHPLGFYKRYGLNVEVIKTAGWAVVRDKTLNKEYDAAHMLSPMPLAITMGAGSAPTPYFMPAVKILMAKPSPWR
jgi:nitrate/nitrite transport system substrate-binding protein